MLSSVALSTFTWLSNHCQSASPQLKLSPLTTKAPSPHLSPGQPPPSILQCSRNMTPFSSVQFSSVQSLSRVRLFGTPQTAARQASLSITNSRSSHKLMSIESVMPSNNLILCCPLFLPPSIFPSIRVFSDESVLLIRWPKCWSFSFNISPSSEHSGLISSRMDWLDLLAVQGTLKESRDLIWAW